MPSAKSLRSAPALPLLLLGSLFLGTSSTTLAAKLPNVVIIITDDQGYGDLGCYGGVQKTPHIDQLAADGMRFTDFYVSQAVCGASRASLLTGCLANRIGMLGAPSDRTTTGIADSEVLLPEICKQKDYATAVYGKWHLGHHLPFLPLQNGFDDYYGLPYSNDMWPHHPEVGHLFGDLPLIEKNEVINPKVTSEDQRSLTKDYTQRAVQFIHDHHDRPFFLYVPHTMVHVPLAVSPEAEGQSGLGAFGDATTEVDWSVGQILGALKERNLEENTLVIYLSDNGPWISYGNHAGSAGPLREGKMTAWEGGVRVPCVMRWPGVIPAGTVCSEVAATIDVLPTIANWIGASLPEHPIDGKDIRPLMTGETDAQSPHEYYGIYFGNQLRAIRSGKWKLHFPHKYISLNGEAGRDGTPSKYVERSISQVLYDLEADVGETTDVSAEHPDVVQRLSASADEIRKELGDSLQNMTGTGIRPSGQWQPPTKEPAK